MISKKDFDDVIKMMSAEARDPIDKRVIMMESEADAILRTLKKQSKLLEEAKEMAEHYSDITSLTYPEDWRCSKEGGPPIYSRLYRGGYRHGGPRVS